MTHRMIFNQTGYFGRGAIAHIAPEIARRGLAKAFIVTDPVLAENGTAARITDLLDEAGIGWEVFSDVAPNPPIKKVQAGLAAFRSSGADVLIGLGGGSPQDTCKAISVIATNPDFEDVLSLEGLSPTTRPGVPIIGVPTTAGTASETTINYVITDTAKQRKFVCVDPHDIPVLAIVDPDLMDGMPRSLKVATGLDALTHAIEGYITPGAWELSDALCLRSIQMIAANLRAAADGDADAVEQMGLAASTAWPTPTSDSVWSTAWPTRWAGATTPRTGSPTGSSWHRSWPSTPSTPGRSTAISLRPSGLRKPGRCHWRRRAPRPWRPWPS